MRDYEESGGPTGARFLSPEDLLEGEGEPIFNSEIRVFVDAPDGDLSSVHLTVRRQEDGSYRIYYDHFRDAMSPRGHEKGSMPEHVLVGLLTSFQELQGFFERHSAVEHEVAGIRLVMYLQGLNDVHEIVLPQISLTVPSQEMPRHVELFNQAMAAIMQDRMSRIDLGQFRTIPG